MKWVKKGLVFCPQALSECMQSYARMPTVLKISSSVYRIYFESRSAKNTAYPFFLDYEILSGKIIDISSEPLLKYGPMGTFDDNGITPFSVLRVQDEIWLYYVGWNLEVKVPFSNAIGLAISKDNGRTFSKVSQGPILARDIYDPYFPTGPLVLYDGLIFKMWYTSFEKWENQGDGIKHYYNIKYRESKDGVFWQTPPQVAIDFESHHEYAFVCRSVLVDPGGLHRMWYSFRAQATIETYRLGYAESYDGLHWIRKDHLMRDFDVSSEGWDNEMICYPHVFTCDDNVYMLYNGNKYGKTGFGLALLES